MKRWLVTFRAFSAPLLILYGTLFVACTMVTVRYIQENGAAATAVWRCLSNLLPDSPGIAYNNGVTLYRRREYRRASAEFLRAILSKEPALSAAARYNLGNALLRQGDALPPGEKQGAMEFYRQAIVRYEEAARLNGAEQDTRFNLAVARVRLRSRQNSLLGENPAPGPEHRGKKEPGAAGRKQTVQGKVDAPKLTHPAVGDQPGGGSAGESAGESEKGNNRSLTPGISRRDAEALIRAQRQPGGSTALFRDQRKPGHSAAVLKDW